MAKVIDTLAVKIIMDAEAVSGGVGKLGKEVQEAARIVASMASPMDTLVSKEARLNEIFKQGSMSADTHALAIKRVRDRMAELSGAGGAGGRDFGGFAAQLPVFGSLFTAVTTAAGAMAAFRTAAGAVESVTVDAGKRIDEVSDQADRLGLSVGALSELKIAANFADVKDFGAVTGFMEKMEISISKAAGGVDDLDLETKKSADAFLRLKLNANELLGLKPEQQFYKIAAAIGEVSTNAERMELLKAIGKGGPELAALVGDVEKFKRMARDSGAVITQDQADAIEKADEALKKYHLSVEALGNTIATLAAPSVAKFADNLSWFLSQDATTIMQRMAAMAGSKGDQNALDIKDKQNVKAKLSKRTQELMGISDEDAGRIPMTLAQEEAKARDEAVASEAVKSKNREKAAAKEAADFAKHQVVNDKQFETDFEKLSEEIELLKMGKQASEEWKIEHSKFNETQRDSLRNLNDRKAAQEALNFSVQEDLKAQKELTHEADAIRQSLLTPQEAAAQRISKAEDLVTLEKLSEEDYQKLLTKEAKGLVGPVAEQHVSAAAFGSQAAIAATLGRDNANTDSQNLQAMKDLLQRLVDKEHETIEEVTDIK